MAETVTYKTRLTLEECVSRLKSRSKRARWVSFRGYPAGTVVHRLKGRSFRLKATLGSYTTNSFQPVFYGSFEPGSDGTLIRGRYKMDNSTRIFMGFWFGFCILMFGLFFWACVIAPATGFETVDRTPYWTILVPIIMVAFGYWLVRFGQRVGLAQKRSMEEFFRTAFEAVEMDSRAV